MVQILLIFVLLEKRGNRSDNVIICRMHSDHIPSMMMIEDKLVGLIIQMTRIRNPLAHSRYFQLDNDFIVGTQFEIIGLNLIINIVL